MIELLLTRRDDLAGHYLSLPTTPAKMGEVFSSLDVISTDISLTRITNVICPVTNIARYIRSANVNSIEDMDILNKLAERIDTMSDKEVDIFSGALDASSINSLDDVLRIADGLDDYVILPNVNTEKELGEFLVDTGYKGFSESVRPYLDYAAIGAEYYADFGGAFGQGGYVRRKSSLEHNISDKHPALITVHIRTMEAEATLEKRFLLGLPATEEELESIKDKMDVDSFTDAFIDKIEFGKPYLEELIPQDCFSVEDANELALSIEEMEQRDGEFIKYLSVLSAMQPETLPAALHLAAEIDGFERVTEDAEEYGKQVLERIGADQELIDTIDGFMDFEAFGEQMMEEDDVRQTPFGMMRRIGGFFPEPREDMTMGGM